MAARKRMGADARARAALDSARGTVQARIDGARRQAYHAWDGLETLFQAGVQRALMQIGVPTAEEIRELTRRVAELNESVKALSLRQGKRRRNAKERAAARPARSARRRARA